MLLPNDFAEHIFNVGSSHDLHSIIQSGLIPGGKDVKTGRHAVIFTAVNPMFVDQHEEVEYDLTKPRIAVYKHTWKVHQNTVYWCNLKVAQSKGLQFYQTLSNAIILYNTLPAVCIENVVNMKSGEDLYSKMCQSPELPQSYSSRFCITDARILPTSKREHPSTMSAESTVRPRCGNIDFRIQGLPHSTVQQQDDHTARKKPKS